MKIVQLTHMTQPQSMGYVIVAKSGEVLAVYGGHNGSGAELKRVLRQFGGHVDLWLLTHPHQDHFNGVIELLTDPTAFTLQTRDGTGVEHVPQPYHIGEDGLPVPAAN